VYISIIPKEQRPENALSSGKHGGKREGDTHAANLPLRTVQARSSFIDLGPWEHWLGGIIHWPVLFEVTCSPTSQQRSRIHKSDAGAL